MTDVFQSRLPHGTKPGPLPGVQPLGGAPWLVRDEAFAGQMAARDRLISQCRDEVVALSPEAEDPAKELLDLVLRRYHPEANTSVKRLDGAEVRIDRDDPMATLGRLVQEDLVILQSDGQEHCLTGAVVCFPASWTLSEKFLKPLTWIHEPVASYDDDLARRVQRLFDGVQPDRPMWRYNLLWYDSPELFHPRTEAEHRTEARRRHGAYLRSERQCILRLRKTRAVVFSIHTYLLRARDLPRAESGRQG